MCFKLSKTSQRQLLSYASVVAVIRYLYQALYLLEATQQACIGPSVAELVHQQHHRKPSATPRHKNVHSRPVRQKSYCTDEPSITSQDINKGKYRAVTSCIYLKDRFTYFHVLKPNSRARVYIERVFETQSLRTQTCVELIHMRLLFPCLSRSAQATVCSMVHTLH